MAPNAHAHGSAASSCIKMKSILVVALLALSDAMSPPNIKDTFIATGEVEIHTAEGTTIGGKCERRHLFFYVGTLY